MEGGRPAGCDAWRLLRWMLLDADDFALRRRCDEPGLGRWPNAPGGLRKIAACRRAHPEDLGRSAYPVGTFESSVVSFRSCHFSMSANERETAPRG